LSTSTTTTITTHPNWQKESSLQQINNNKQICLFVGLLLLFVCFLCCMGATYESEQGIYLNAIVVNWHAEANGKID
jgi:hypothetical protein